MCDKIRMKDTDKFITLHSYNNHTKVCAVLFCMCVDDFAGMYYDFADVVSLSFPILLYFLKIYTR